MEPVQVLLFTVVSILTGLLLAVGIQVFIILHEVKKSLTRLNRILERAENISDAVARPVQGISNFMENVKGIKDVIDLLVDKHEKSATMQTLEQRFAPTIFPEIEVEEQRVEPESHSRISLLQERGRRFFHKSGKSLSS